MKLSLLAVCALLVVGAARLPVEHALFLERTRQHLNSAPPLDLSLREQLGQLGFVAALERFSFACGRFPFHPGARRLGTHRVEPRPALFRADDDAAAARDSLLGHGGVAHGVECERRRAQRSRAAAARAARQSATRIFRSREGFPRTRDQEQPGSPATLRSARPPLPRQVQGSRPRCRILRESRGETGRAELRQTFQLPTSFRIAKGASTKRTKN